MVNMKFQMGRHMMANKIFHARIGSPFKEEHAQEIGEFISNVEDKSTTGILDAIRQNKKHTIAEYIEWNNKIASEQYRLQQVRNIVNHITVEVVEIGDKLPLRMFYSVRIPENNTPVYMDYESVASDKFTLDQIINRAKIELENWIERYQQYSQLENIVSVIKKALRK